MVAPADRIFARQQVVGVVGRELLEPLRGWTVIALRECRLGNGSGSELK
jgi:hypothetical protein